MLKSPIQEPTENTEDDELINESSFLDIISKEQNTSLEDFQNIYHEEKTAKELTGGSSLVVKRIYELFKKDCNNNLAAIPTKDLQGMPLDRATEILQMFKFYKENWKKYPKLGENLLNGLVSKLIAGEEKTKIHKAVKNKNILAFLRIDDLGDGKKYFGSFNTLPNLKGFGIGTALLKKVLEKEGKDSLISAICTPWEDISSTYIDHFGFIINGIHTNYDKTGDPMLKIERKDGATYYYDDYSDKDIIKEYELNFSENTYKQGEQFIILKFKKNSPELINKIAELTNNGEYIISKYFYSGKDNKEVYCTFEKTIRHKIVKNKNHE